MKRPGEQSPKDGLAAKFKVNDVEEKRIFTKGRAARGVRRCFSAWMRCPYKSKEQHRRDRNQRNERKGINNSLFHCKCRVGMITRCVYKGSDILSVLNKYGFQ